MIDSFKQGGTGVYSQLPLHPDEMPLKFEFGTHNYPGIVSLYAGIDFIENIGVEVLNSKTRDMIDYIIDEISDLDNVILYNKKPDLPVIALNIDGIENDDVGFVLQKQYKIMTRTGLHCAPLVHDKIDNGKGCVRISLSYFNTMDECKLLINAIKTIARNIRKLEIC